MTTNETTHARRERRSCCALCLAAQVHALGFERYSGRLNGTLQRRLFGHIIAAPRAIISIDSHALLVTIWEDGDADTVFTFGEIVAAANRQDAAQQRHDTPRWLRRLHARGR